MTRGFSIYFITENNITQSPFYFPPWSKREIACLSESCSHFKNQESSRSWFVYTTDWAEEPVALQMSLHSKSHQIKPAWPTIRGDRSWCWATSHKSQVLHSCNRITRYLSTAVSHSLKEDLLPYQFAHELRLEDALHFPSLGEAHHVCIKELLSHMSSAVDRRTLDTNNVCSLEPD